MVHTNSLFCFHVSSLTLLLLFGNSHPLLSKQRAIDHPQRIIHAFYPTQTPPPRLKSRAFPAPHSLQLITDVSSCSPPGSLPNVSDTGHTHGTTLPTTAEQRTAPTFAEGQVERPHAHSHTCIPSSFIPRPFILQPPSLSSLSPFPSFPPFLSLLFLPFSLDQYTKYFLLPPSLHPWTLIPSSSPPQPSPFPLHPVLLPSSL